jgi:signal transduction histidine kinase/ligand-binding sensor domain-containing protein
MFQFLVPLRFFLGILGSVAMFSSLKAQQYIFETIGYEQGLPDENLLCVFRDQEGLMWFGGGSGLFCYDGYEFKAFRHIPDDETSLSSNTVWDIAEDDQQRLWIATSRGVCILNKERSLFSAIKQTEEGEDIAAKRAQRVVTDNGYVYVALSRFGIIQFDNRLIGNKISGDELNGVLAFGEIDISTNSAGSFLYTTSENSLIRVDILTNNVTFFDRPDERVFGSTDEYTVVLQDTNDPDILWCSIRPLGMMKFHMGTRVWSHVNFIFDDPTIEKPTHIRDFYFTDDNLVMAYCEHGLFTFDRNTLLAYCDYEDGRSEYGAAPALEWSNRMYKDVEGFVWITTGKGVLKINPAAQYIHYYKELLDFSISHVCSSGDSLLYGVAYREKEVADFFRLNIRSKRLERFPLPSGVLVPNGVYQVKGFQDEIWVVHTAGFDVFDISINSWSKECSKLNAFIAEADNLIDAEVIGDDIYFTTLSEGAHLYHRNTKTIEKLDHSQASTFHLLTRKENDLWLSGPHLSPVEKVYCLHLSTMEWDEFDLGGMYQSESIGVNQTLLEATTGGWIIFGTQSNGLLRFNPYTTENWRETIGFIDGRQGLHDAYVFTASPDNRGNLWLGGRNGIYKVLHTGEVVNYGPREGLFNNVVNRITYLESFDQVYADYPQVFVDVENNFDLPLNLTLHVNRIQIVGNQRELNVDSIITMSHHQNAFSVSYAALDYFHAHQIRYRYKLEGMDADWIEAGSSRLINYAGIPPGDYTLFIEAWDETNTDRRGGKKITLKVIPAYYQTSWFRILLIVLGIVSVYLVTSFYRNQKLKLRMTQLAKEREMNATRARISHDIHDEIGAGLTLISLRGQSTLRKMDKDPDAVKGNMEKVIFGAQDLTRSLGEIVWSVNPKHDNVSSFIAFVRNYVDEFLEDSDISYSIVESVSNDEMLLTPELRRNLFLIIKESINNSVKHGNPKVITIRMEFTDSGFTIVILDDGLGFDVQIAAQSSRVIGGNGLQGMRERAEKVGARLEVKSSQGKGSSIAVEGPL